MSAICGLWYKHGQVLEVPVLETMVHSLAHRGIDGMDWWQSNSIGFAIQKFTVTPEAVDEILPFYDPALQIAIVGDIRLDNRAELFNRLKIAPSDSAMSDSQLVLKAYARWGKVCADYLMGDFVIAVWNQRDQELIFITDPAGMRTVYYYHCAQFFAFASEAKALHKVPGIPCQPNLTKIAQLTSLGDADSHLNSYFQDIFLLPTASVITVTKNTYVARKYWQPDLNLRSDFRSEQQTLEAFQALFSQAVNARLRSRYPLVSLLSGGLDSSSITGMAAQLLYAQGKSLRAMSAVLPSDYAGKMIDEQRFIKQFKDYPGIQLSPITDFIGGPFSALTSLIKGGESPNFTSRHYLYSAFAKSAFDHGERVFLDGCFGELGPTFHGQGYWAELLLAGKWGRLFAEVRAKARVENRSYASILKNDIIRPLLPDAWFKPRFDIAQMQQNSLMKPAFIHQQLGADYRYTARQANAATVIKPNHRYNQWLNQCYLLSRPRTQQGFVGYEQVCSVYPFADKALLSFCLSLPGEMKVNKGYKRYLIRSGTQGIMPEAIRQRTCKEPFSPDYHERYNSQRQTMLDYLEELNPSVLSQEMVDIERLKHGLQATMHTNRCSTVRDFAAMHTIPRALYLLIFLKEFFK